MRKSAYLFELRSGDSVGYLYGGNCVPIPSGARIWPKVRSNALEPGWVATRMGGAGATGDLSKGHITQAWLAVSNDALALSSGEYFFHKKLRAPNPIARDEVAQGRLLEACARLSGVPLDKYRIGEQLDR